MKLRLSRDEIPAPLLKYFRKAHPIQAKSMIGIPERFMFMMFDLGYILRNKIIWHKPNPMPSSVKDRFNTTYEMLYFFSKTQKYWFDLDAVRKPYTEPLNRWGGNEVKISEKTKWKSDDEKAKWCMSIGDRQSRPNPSGKNPGDCWSINTQPYPDAHFATFPQKLVEKPLLAGCPAEVCSVCGMARVRITKNEEIPMEEAMQNPAYLRAAPNKDGEYYGEGTKDYKPSMAENPSEAKRRMLKAMRTQSKTIGWTDCHCLEEDKYKSGIVIDPFGGSGTVGIVAERLGRSSILIDIKKDYCEMAIKRLKPLVEQTKLTGKQSTIKKEGF